MASHKQWLGSALLLVCFIAVTAPAQAQATISYTSCGGSPTPLLSDTPGEYCSAGTNIPYDYSVTYASTDASGTCYYDPNNLTNTDSIWGSSSADAIEDEYYAANVQTIAAFFGAPFAQNIQTTAYAESDGVYGYATSEGDCYSTDGYQFYEDIGMETSADTELGQRG